jgi:hypothetical protein
VYARAEQRGGMHRSLNSTVSTNGATLCLKRFATAPMFAIALARPELFLDFFFAVVLS